MPPQASLLCSKGLKEDASKQKSSLSLFLSFQILKSSFSFFLSLIFDAIHKSYFSAFLFLFLFILLAHFPSLIFSRYSFTLHLSLSLSLSHANAHSFFHHDSWKLLTIVTLCCAVKLLTHLSFNVTFSKVKVVVRPLKKFFSVIEHRFR